MGGGATCVRDGKLREVVSAVISVIAFIAGWQQCVCVCICGLRPLSLPHASFLLSLFQHARSVLLFYPRAAALALPPVYVCPGTSVCLRPGRKKKIVEIIPVTFFPVATLRRAAGTALFSSLRATRRPASCFFFARGLIRRGGFFFL